MTERNSTNFKKDVNTTMEADGLVKLLNSWTFDSSRDEEDFVVPNKDSSAVHLYTDHLRRSILSVLIIIELWLLPVV